MTRALATGLVLFVASVAFAVVSDAYGWELSAVEATIHLPGWMTPVLRVAMQAGNQLAVATVALVFVIFDRPRRASIALLAGWGAWGVADGVKVLVGRPRPSAGVLGFSPAEFVTGNGYPSGHTTIAVALAVVLVTSFGVPRTIKVLAVVAAVLTAAGRVNLAVHWPLDVIGGASIGLLVGGIVVIALDPAPIRPPWPGVGVWPPPRPDAAPSPLHGGESDRTLRVATFNIRNGRALDGRHVWPFRRGSTLDAIRGLQADVVGLQEVYAFQRRWLERHLRDRRWIGYGRTDGLGRGEQCPILWRPSRLELATWEVRWFSEDWSEAGSRFEGARFPRIATLAQFVDRGTGGRFGVVNAHLDSKERTDRILSAQLILDWIDEAHIPWMVLGDLNDGPDSPPVEQLVQGGLVAALPPGDPGTIHQFTGRTDGRRIDHLLVSPELTVGSAAVRTVNTHRLLPSDHWPLVAEVGGLD